MGKPIILFLTGIPGTGKTSMAARLTEKCRQVGASIHFINDYPLLEQWAKQHRGDEARVHWTPDDVFLINPQAYPEASSFIAQEISREIQLHEIPQDIFVVESARGAGIDGQRDRYDDHLFMPFISSETLMEAFRLANIEMVCDIETVMQRVEERFKRHPESAPPVVVRKYISEVEGIQSSWKQARELDGFVLNEVIDNSGSPEQTQVLMDSILALLVADLAHEHLTRPEGQPRGGHEWK